MKNESSGTFITTQMRKIDLNKNFDGFSACAELTGITLICFTRGRRMKKHSHPKRMKPFKRLINYYIG